MMCLIFFSFLFFVNLNEMFIFNKFSLFLLFFNLNILFSYLFNQNINYNQTEYCLKYSFNELCSIKTSNLCLNCYNLLNKIKLNKLDNLLSSYSYCKLGFSRIGHIALKNQKIEDKCINRGYDNRTSLTKIWKDN